eukprot:349632-Chlamydomonas_euryale.AAC.50
MPYLQGYMERLDAVVAAQQIEETAGAAVAGGDVFKPLFLCALPNKDVPARREDIADGQQEEPPGSRLHPGLAAHNAAAARKGSEKQPTKPVRGAAAVKCHAHNLAVHPAQTSTDPGISGAAAGAPDCPGTMTVSTAAYASDAQLLVNSMEQELAEVKSEVSQAQCDHDKQQQEVNRLEEQV